MSSDSDKLRCLKILAEVEQYVLQDKRDPSAVAEVLKDIINVAEPERPIDPDSKEVVRLIKEATTQGRLKWRIKRFSNSYDLVSENPHPSYLVRYEIYISIGFWESSRTVRHLRIFLDANYREVDLTKEDKRFFFDVFNQVFQEKEDNPIRAAKKALEADGS